MQGNAESDRARQQHKKPGRELPKIRQSQTSQIDQWSHEESGNKMAASQAVSFIEGLEKEGEGGLERMTWVDAVGAGTATG